MAGRCTSSAPAARRRTTAAASRDRSARGETRAGWRGRSTCARARRESSRPPQLAKPEDPGGVAVGEVDADAVVADQVHVCDRQIFGHLRRIEDALAGGLGLAVRARALD